MNIGFWLYLFKYSLGKQGAISAYRRAIKNQNLSADNLEAISWQKTVKLLTYAYLNVPWYKERFKSIGLEPGDIKHPDDFPKVPVLTRSDIKENFELFVSKKVKPSSLKISTTGGSTGTPLRIGMRHNAIRETQKWQLLSWWGLSPLANMATIYRELPVNDFKRVALNLIQWPQRTIKIDATNLNESTLEFFIEKFIRIKPEYIHGYVGALDVIADYILDNNIKLRPPKVVWATASPLNKITESKISNAFKAPVCDQYGCSEVYYISAECPFKQGLHIFSDSRRVEILNENNQLVPNGHYGKIIVTNLDEFYFPLIRYENGDSGRLLENRCSCGMPLPLMDKVKGRVSDNLKLPDGTRLAGEYFTTIFDNYTEEVKQFQVLQHSNLDITINIVFKSDSQIQGDIISQVSTELQKRIKHQVIITFNKLSSIPQTNGKLRYIVKE